VARWEIRGRWPSIEEIERRFDELIRTRWGVPGRRPAAAVEVRDDQISVEIDLSGVEELEACDVAGVTVEGRVLRIQLRRERGG
jgi:HSP20 family molecular chaperone IbpA